jgi:hypothetical protein
MADDINDASANSANGKLYKFARYPKRKRRFRVIFTPKQQLYRDSLWKCTSVDAVKAWLIKGHKKFTRKALAAIKRRKIDGSARSMLEDLLGNPVATSTVIMTNQRLVTDAFLRLHNELVAITQADPEIQFGFVTFISGDGGTSLNRPVIELFESQKRVQSTLRAMSPNFIGVTELAFFNSHSHPDGGSHVQRHEHALIFGKDISGAAEVAARHTSKYTANITDAEIIVVRALVDSSDVNLARIAAYLLKAPSKAMNWCPPREGKKGHMNQSEKGDRCIRYLRIAQLRTMLTIEDCLFAGGLGQGIRRNLVKVLRTLAAADAPKERRIIHPDAIPSFWVHLAQVLRRDKWALPIIKRQP